MYNGDATTLEFMKVMNGKLPSKHQWAFTNP
jgi:hypothetical protein